jgi:hypothetical protein
MFRKKIKRNTPLTLADMSTRTRGFILDSQIQNAHEISIMLGCSSISNEVAEMEEQQSEKRVEKLSYLVPLLYAYAKTLADGTTAYQKENLPEELQDISSEVWVQSRKMMEEFAFSVLIGAFSQIIDMDLLDIPKDKR